MDFRKHFGYDVQEASDEAVVVNQGQSLTIQSMSEDADINVMMKRFGIGQKLPENPRVPVFGDFSGISDFQSAMDAINEAQDAFMEFPPDVRAKFENSPQKLLEFVAKDSNYEEAVKLGLMKAGAKAPSGLAPVAPVGAPGGAPPAGGGSPPSPGSPV